MQKQLCDSMHQLRSVDLKLLEAQISNATRAATVGTSSADLYAMLKRIATLETKSETLERRASRGAEHNERQDDRIRKLEGKA